MTLRVIWLTVGSPSREAQTTVDPLKMVPLRVKMPIVPRPGLPFQCRTSAEARIVKVIGVPSSPVTRG